MDRRLRRAAFQVHLWTGVALALYVIVLCATGSALVFRIEIERAMRPPMPAYQPERQPLDTARIATAARRAHPGWEVTRVGSRIRPYNPTIEVWLERDGRRQERLFDPYTGADLGDARPLVVDALDWMADLHDRLLLGETGSRLNAAASALVAVLALTGIVVWWPRAGQWRRALTVRREASPFRFTWRLHGTLGAWCAAFVLLWAMSGVYLAYPEPFAAAVDRYADPRTPYGERAGDIALDWATRLHFGRFPGSPWLQVLWVVLGLLPVVLAGSGVLLWTLRTARRLKKKEAGPKTRLTEET